VPDPQVFPIPDRFETERLLLRVFEPEDAVQLHQALVESIDILRRFLWFLPWVAEEQTLLAAEVRCRRAKANFLLRTDLAYAVLEKTTGRLVGSVGLHRTDWKLPSSEVGYWFRSSAVGNGYASEAVRAVSGWAITELQVARLELITLEDNTASRSVAERCGFVLEGVHPNAVRGPDGVLRNRCTYASVRSAA
jgi:RimJ/RimL family protein N-acetyltransferase